MLNRRGLTPLASSTLVSSSDVLCVAVKWNSFATQLLCGVWKMWAGIITKPTHFTKHLFVAVCRLVSTFSPSSNRIRLLPSKQVIGGSNPSGETNVLGFCPGEENRVLVPNGDFYTTPKCLKGHLLQSITLPSEMNELV